jgi:serine/threonine protein kinase/tetratricopeptide (TPR) repeat protein
MACPSADELLAFHLGDLAEARIAAVGEHMSACVSCEQRARQLDSLSDGVLTILHRAGEIAPGQSAAPPVPGPDIPGYELLGFLGKGGMGCVYKARHQRLGRLVALKCLRADGPPELERFQAEAQTVARLQHPNIIQIFEVGEWQGEPFLSLEFVDGGTLADHLHGKPEDARLSAALVQTLARAVHYAHTQGIVHRDLKPANILMSIADGRLPIEAGQSAIDNLNSAVPKIADFGIAKHLQVSGQTREGDIVGTAAYMAPEQAAGRGAAIGPASDIYSLGVILYELLTGRVPLQGATDLETLLSVQTEEPVPPRQLQPRLPQELQTICLKCLRKEPGARYASADDLARDLGRHLAGEPIAARPTPLWKRTWKWTRRRPALAALVVLTALIVGVGFPGATYLWVRADRAHAAELAHRQKAEAAAEAEARAKRRAEARETDTLAVLHFVETKLLASPRPQGQSGGLGHEVTMRQALDEALPFVGKGFAKQPVIEARLRAVLGQSYYYLGEAVTAAEQLQTACTLLSQYIPHDHPDALRTVSQLANSYKALGRYVEADKLYQKTLALQTERLGPSDRDTLATMCNLASNYSELHRNTEARTLQEKALALQEASFGRDDPATLSNMHNLALTYARLGLRDDSLKLEEETLRRRRTALGPTHPDTLHSMNNLAVTYGEMGRHEDAFKLDKETFELRKDKIGPNHPETLRSMHNLAISYATLGKHEEAHALRVETLARRRARLGDDHPDTLWSMWSTATGLVKLDRAAEAVPLIDECVKLSAGKVVNPRMIPAVMDMRLQIFAQDRDAAGCRATAEMWERLNRTDVTSLYRAAGMRAVTAAVLGAGNASASAADADQAMVWLRKAVAAGFRDAAHLRQNNDLRVLRDRDDFKQLLAQLEAGKDKK